MLEELVLADDREEFAENRNLDYKDGALRVEVSLVDGGDVPVSYLHGEYTRYGDTVVAYVTVSDLVDLAAHDEVRLVAPVIGPQTNGSTLR